jgi:hypothetical protein
MHQASAKYEVCTTSSLSKKHRPLKQWQLLFQSEGAAAEGAHLRPWEKPGTSAVVLWPNPGSNDAAFKFLFFLLLLLLQCVLLSSLLLSKLL